METISSIGNIKGVSPGVNGKTSLSYEGRVMEDVDVQGRIAIALCLRA